MISMFHNSLRKSIKDANAERRRIALAAQRTSVTSGGEVVTKLKPAIKKSKKNKIEFEQPEEMDKREFCTTNFWYQALVIEIQIQLSRGSLVHASVTLKK